MSLKKQLEDVQLSLNKSYDKLEYHKETLNQQAERVKEQILNNIAMQIDAFNQRKKWLVNQLDLVKCDKMDSIQRQQDAVKCSMLNIKKFIIDPNKYTNAQIKEELENINNLLSEESRPFLAFRSDSAALREIISQYGGILKQYSGHFADPARPSISLPRVVEEEDDEENMSFARKYEMQSKNDQNILYISKHPTNSSIVRAWLMTTNEAANVNAEIESDTLKSDHESFVRIDSSDSLDIKRAKDECGLNNENKDLWLPKIDKTSNINASENPLKPFFNTDKHDKSLWLLDSSTMDEEKDVDHCDVVKRVCNGGNCKTFYECSEIENCCSRLIDPKKPSLNKWLIDNQIINPQLLNTATINIVSRNPFSSKFSKVLNADNDKWLDRRNVAKRHIDCLDDKMNTNSDLWLSTKMSKVCCLNNSAFNSPLDKWVSWGREQAWVTNKEKICDYVDKSMEKLTMDDVDGLVDSNGCKNDSLGIDCSKWLATR